jgi:hypothetical protein
MWCMQSHCHYAPRGISGSGVGRVPRTDKGSRRTTANCLGHLLESRSYVYCFRKNKWRWRRRRRRHSVEETISGSPSPGRITESKQELLGDMLQPRPSAARPEGVRTHGPKNYNCGITSVPDFYSFFLNPSSWNLQNPVLKSNLGRRKLYGRASPSEENK